MIKHVSINRFEGTGIIERVEGNGWDIDADHIELNGVNARISEDPESRSISLNGPAVEDLFENLREMLKENAKLRKNIDDMQMESHESKGCINDTEKNNEVVNYCANDILTTETLYLRQVIEKQDEYMRKLKNDLKEKEAVIRDLQFYKDNYEERCEILDEAVKGKNECIKTLNKELKDKDAEIDELKNELKNTTIRKYLSIIRHNNELIEKCNFLENKLELADKWNPIKDFIRETTGDNIDYATVTVSHLMPGYYVTVSVSKQEDDDNG